MYRICSPHEHERRMKLGKTLAANLAPTLAVLVCVAALAGCGDNRPKIRRPDKPTQPPNASMKLHMESASQPAPKPEEAAAEKE
jgi:hypothetical protein